MVLPRVSQIIAPYAGYSKIPKKVLDKAASRGTLVHEACLAMTLKQPYNLDVEYANYALSFAQFMPKIQKIISYEVRIDDAEWKYTGKYDYVAEVKGYEGAIIFDIKSANKAKDLWGCQLAAYGRLCEKYANLRPSALVCVHLSREGKAPKLIEYDYESFLGYFKSMCDMYHLFKPDEPELLYD